MAETLGISVRAATNADLDGCARLIANESGGPQSEWRERFAAVLSDPNRRFLVALLEDVLVAYGQARFLSRGDSADFDSGPSGWFLSGVVVAPECRRRGIASRLTQARLDLLRETSQVVYYAAEPNNVATMGLHKQFGFDEVGTLLVPGHDLPLQLWRLTLAPNV